MLLQATHSKVSRKVVDWAHTFPSEVSLMWPGKLSAIKVLYFLNRYFIVDIVASFARMSSSLSTLTNLMDHCTFQI